MVSSGERNRVVVRTLRVLVGNILRLPRCVVPSGARMPRRFFVGVALVADSGIMRC